MDKSIILKNQKVIFADLEDKGYGKSITIEVDADSKKLIQEWVKEYNINGGTAKFKTYVNEKTKETTEQYTFKFSKFTQIAPADARIGFGAIVNLQARAYEYNNKFGKGVSASLAGVYVITPAKNSMMENLAK